MLYKQLIYIFLIIGCSTCIQAADKSCICIFDIDHAFSYVDRLQLIRHLTWQEIYDNVHLTMLWNISSDCFTSQGMERMQSEILDALHGLEASSSTSPNTPTTYYAGKPLPPVLRKWILGQVTSQQATDYAIRLLQHKNASSYLTPSTQALYPFIIRLIFCAEKIAKSLNVRKDILKMIRGWPKDRIKSVIFGNTRQDIMKTTQKQEHMKDAFSHIDSTYTAEETGLLRPQEMVIHHIAKAYNVPLHHCIVIEGEPAHATYLQQRGYACFLYQGDAHDLQERIMHYLSTIVHTPIKYNM